jgi:ligand-binding SRPBCC domain-containing protein
MKLKNRQNNNYFEFDDCIMRGEIEMTPDEWKEAYAFLDNEYRKALKDYVTYTKDSLYSGFVARNLEGTELSIGVTATKLLVDKYKLKNYKDGNYLIVIK